MTEPAYIFRGLVWPSDLHRNNSQLGDGQSANRLMEEG